jgi:hypothetical protein
VYSAAVSGRKYVIRPSLNGAGGAACLQPPAPTTITPQSTPHKTTRIIFMRHRTCPRKNPLLTQRVLKLQSIAFAQRTYHFAEMLR